MLVGFIGSPCCGKTTTAFGLCHTLKTRGHAVEFFPEYARRHIIQTRLDGGIGNGGIDGQRQIYARDCTDAAFYRAHAEAISITDGSSANCYFYGLDTLCLRTEIARYDILFYVSIGAVPDAGNDANRVQSNVEIMHMAERWDKTLRPLLGQVPELVEIRGYPHQNLQDMTAQCVAVIESRLRTQTTGKTPADIPAFRQVAAA